MPEFENVDNFPSESDNLPQIEMDMWKNMIFIINDKKCEITDIEKFLRNASEINFWLNF